jgi:cell division protein FtsI/penicillin-binding protein 2
MSLFRHSKGFKNKKIKNQFSDIEPNEALLDRLAQRKEVEIGLSGKRFEVPLSKSVLQVFFILIILIFVFLFARTFQMQVLEGKDYSAKAQENKFLISQIQAERGVVYDQNMEQLVYNDPSFDLVASGANLPEGADMEKELQEISEIIGLNVETIKEKI